MIKSWDKKSSIACLAAFSIDCFSLKSLNNLYTLKDLAEKGYEPLVYRMFNFTSNYRAQINFTFDAMEAAKISLARLREGYLKHSEGTENISDEKIKEYEERFLEAINDDLNMPQAMSVVWDVVKHEKKSKSFANLLMKFDEVLGLNIDAEDKLELSDEVLDILNKRKIARDNKDYSLSDNLRDKLKELGYIVKDTKDGQKLEKV